VRSRVTIDGREHDGRENDGRKNDGRKNDGRKNDGNEIDGNKRREALTLEPGRPSSRAAAGALLLAAGFVTTPALLQRRAWPSRNITLGGAVSAGGGPMTCSPAPESPTSSPPRSASPSIVDNRGGAGGTIAPPPVARIAARRLHPDDRSTSARSASIRACSPTSQLRHPDELRLCRAARAGAEHSGRQSVAAGQDRAGAHRLCPRQSRQAELQHRRQRQRRRYRNGGIQRRGKRPRWLPVPYRGTGSLALTDLLAGQVQLTMTGSTAVLASTSIALATMRGIGVSTLPAAARSRPTSPPSPKPCRDSRRRSGTASSRPPTPPGTNPQAATTKRSARS